MKEDSLRTISGKIMAWVLPS